MDFKLIAASVVFLPLLSALLVGLNTSRFSNTASHVFTCIPLVISALLSAVLFKHIVFDGNVLEIKLLNWFNSGGFIACWAIYVDVLTAVMLIVVTWVSALVHIYSIGYMCHDPHQPRFMAYLSLFTFCMLMLVTSNNFMQLFFGWEGVGVCSYLLIGFWFKKDSANSAAMKAFLVNRVGDLGFALGIFTVFMVFGNIHFYAVFDNPAQHMNETISLFGEEYNAITVICLLLFMGAMGKSAQLGLHTWLPDAMEGPTPVSALIHAATMVTAGVFMLARCSPLFECSETALNVVTIVGALTCLFAASVALVQDDIKKIIAYSTCSQLGYMFFACGVSAYAAGVFHLMTHAFFKALLFLGAGSVIHAMSDEQDIQKMGGIYKKIPYTYAMMWIGSLALAGVYPFAGFFSKDIILESAYMSGNLSGQIAYWFGIVAAILTAFYSWRLLILSFHGKPRASKTIMSHVHESGLSMLIPLFILSIGAILSGIIGYKFFGMVSGDGTFWQGAIQVAEDHTALLDAHHSPTWVFLMPSVAGIVGIALAYLLYMYIPSIAVCLRNIFGAAHTFLLNKWYFDELYDSLFVKPSKCLGRFFWRAIDAKIVDGMPNGSASISAKLASIVSSLQTGYIYHYAFVMLLGLLGLLSWALFLG